MFTLWRRLNGRRRVDNLSRRAVLVTRDDGSGVLMKFFLHSARGIKWNTVTSVDTRRPWVVRRRVRRASATLADVLPEDVDEVLSVPMWAQARWAQVLRFVTIVGLWAGLVALLTVLGMPVGAAVPLSMLGFIAALFRAPRLGPVAIRSLDQLPLGPGNIVEYATRRLDGVHPEALDEIPHREQVLARIADIREEYGARKLDVLLRIDEPALFDGAAPTTAPFLAALVLAEDADIDMPIAQLESLASRLEVTFEVAKAHARSVGIAHLPEDKRDDARRAAKVARLATESPNDGERRAAAAQLTRILESMALYYMPSVDEVHAIEAPRR